MPAHGAHGARRRVGVLVAGRPQNELDERRREVDALLGEMIMRPPRITRICAFGENAGGFELRETGGEDVRGDTLARSRKFIERTQALEHQVANDEQRPAVTEDLERGADRAA